MVIINITILKIRTKIAKMGISRHIKTENGGGGKRENGGMGERENGPFSPSPLSHSLSSKNEHNSQKQYLYI